MTRTINVLIIFLFVMVFSGCAEKKKAAIRIDDVEISQDEFLQAYQKSPFYYQKSADPKEFLDQYIARKVILREAERHGVDKDPQFLADLQQYWEQSLLKLVLAQKNEELSAGISVSEEEVAAYYTQNKEKLFLVKSLDDARQEIKEFLGREK